MKLLTAAFLSILLLSSCSDSERATANNFNNPETVGTLSDGRVVKRSEVERGGLNYSHWIYYVEQPNGETTISNNFAVQHGKTSSSHAVIYIDGVEYQKKED